jgi:hypothetical protein
VLSGVVHEQVRPLVCVVHTTELLIQPCSGSLDAVTCSDYA